MSRAKTKDREAPVLFDDEQPKQQPIAKTDPKPKPQKTGTNVAKFERPAADPSNLLISVMSAIADPKCDPAKMQALLDVRERLMREEAHVQFISAYIDMRAALPSISKDGKITAQGISKKGNAYSQVTRYATYENINEVTMPILSKHRFALLLLPDVGKDGNGIVMRAQLACVCDTAYGRIVHAEHCAIAAPIESGGSKNNVQGIGSSLSYTKRYCSVTLLNLISHAPEDRDTDGNPPAGKSRGAHGKQAEQAPDESTVDYDIAITPEQAKALHAEITDGVGVQRFCEKYGLAKVEELPSAFYAEAMKACKAFKDAKAAKQ